jgi:hypothetical protein
VKQISSKRTFFIKRVFPVLWFGFIAFFVVVSFVMPAAKNTFHAEFLIGPVFMAVLGFIIMKRLVFDLADEVWDDGDALVVRYKGWEERIALANIINVSSTTMTNPPRITLTLREPCRFGKEVTFSPPGGILPWSRPKIAAELVERIDATRRR